MNALRVGVAELRMRCEAEAIAPADVDVLFDQRRAEQPDFVRFCQRQLKQPASREELEDLGEAMEKLGEAIDLLEALTRSKRS
ncbi:MAG TPA: hypothetical protein VL135_02760 [Terracidiphilus sp.]|nr:hypothetical protein [Terracidiphilus sp.]